MNRKYLILNIIICILLIFFVACNNYKKIYTSSHALKEIFSQNDIIDIIRRIENKNKTLFSFKGIGKIKIATKSGIKISEKIAWVGLKPDKIYVVSFGLSQLRFSYDGKSFYFVDINNDFFKKQDSNILEKILKIPISITDMVQLLSGNVPIHDFKHALIDKDNNKYVMLLKNIWGTQIEKIYFDNNLVNIPKIEIYYPSGSIKYYIQFNKIEEVDTYKIPKQIIISNDDTVFSLNIEKFWTNPIVSNSQFIIENKGNK